MKVPDEQLTNIYHDTHKYLKVTNNVDSWETPPIYTEIDKMQLHEFAEQNVLANFDYQHANKRSAFITGDEELWLAVLEQSICDYKELWLKRRIFTLEYMELFDWFFKDDGEEVGTFNWICNNLNLSKITIKRSLLVYSKLNI